MSRGFLPHLKSVSPAFLLLKKMVTDGRKSILVPPPYVFPLKIPADLYFNANIESSTMLK